MAIDGRVEGTSSVHQSTLAPGYKADPVKLKLRNKALDYAERHQVDFISAVEAIEQGAT